MKRRNLTKGLKILSVASAVMICSATMMTTEEASAGVFTRFLQRMRNGISGKGFYTNQQRSNLVTTGTRSGLRPQQQATPELTYARLNFPTSSNESNILPRNTDRTIYIKVRDAGIRGATGGDPTTPPPVPPKSKAVRDMLKGSSSSSTGLTSSGVATNRDPATKPKHLLLKTRRTDKPLVNPYGDYNPEDFILPRVKVGNMKRSFEDGDPGDPRGPYVVWRRINK